MHEPLSSTPDLLAPFPARRLRQPTWDLMVNPNRRDPARRAAFVQSVVTHVVQSPIAQFTVETVQNVLDVSPDIAHRILHRLSSAGLLQETRGGVWMKVMRTPH